MASFTSITRRWLDRDRLAYHGYSTVALLYVAAAVVNVLFGFLMRYSVSPEFMEDDEAEYYALARQLGDGTLQINGRRTLGFPVLLSLAMKVSPNFVWTQVLVSLFYSLSIPLFYYAVLRASHSTRAGLFSALSLMLWPPALIYGNSLYSESAAMPFLMLLLIALPFGRFANGTIENTSWPAYVFAGLLCGILTHVRPMYLLIVPFVLLVILVENRRLILSATRGAMLILGFLVAIVPWSVLATKATHSSIFVTASAGETLAGGLNPKLVSYEGGTMIKLPDRNSWQGPGKWVSPDLTGFVSEEELQLPYASLSKVLGQRCVAWIMSNPAHAAYLEIRKLAYMWGIYPGLANGMKQFLMGNIPIVLLLAWTAISAAMRPALAARHVRFLVLPVFVSAVALISWGSWRFRLPGDVGLIAYCAIATVSILRDRLAAATELTPLMQLIKDVIGTAPAAQT